ncbi:YcnI family protein [uncultured Jatrophihabitans sp.]|uniref:YcnI family protein n=1 Tax=uncultured Jatrophihabitans sp. TaxID=1610747 RepID=UPI0035C9E170
MVGLGLVSAAEAHVTVNSPSATQGGYSTVNVKAPTESDTASTTALAVQLPTNHPIAAVSVQPHAGWTFTVKKIKLTPALQTDDGEVSEAVSEIDCKATSAAAAIKPGEFDQFSVSAGPLPKVGSMTFKAIRTYSDGHVVKWVEQSAPGSTTAPDHPAPTLQLAAATSEDAAAASTSPPAGVTATSEPAAAASSSDGSSATATTGVVLGAIGVVLGGGALALAVVRRRSLRCSRADGIAPCGSTTLKR